MMNTPHYHDGLAPGTADALTRVKEISEWFTHINLSQSPLRIQRIKALQRLRDEGWSNPKISLETGLRPQRVKDLLREGDANGGR